MNITIEVRPKRADEDFTFADLELFHQDCGGGVITKTEDKNNGWWNFKYNRCGAKGAIHVHHEGTIGLIQTAIDGKTRKVSLSSSSDYYQAVQRKAWTSAVGEPDADDCRATTDNRKGAAPQMRSALLNSGFRFLGEHVLTPQAKDLSAWYLD